MLPLAQPELELVIDLLLRQVQRPILQEVHDGVEAIAELGREGAPLAGDRGDHVRDQSGDRTDGGEKCQERRRVAGHDLGEEVDHRLEDRGEHQCHEQADEDRDHLRGGVEEQADDNDDAQSQPGPHATPHQPGG